MYKVIGNCCFFGKTTKKKAIWEITDKCQQQCYHCSNYNRRMNMDIKQNEINKIIEELNDNKFEQVLLTGGEPFLNRHIFFIIDKLIEKGIDVSISTNGMLLLDNLNKLKDRKIKKIIVSLDSLNSELYKRLRGKNTSLTKVLKGIEAINNNTNICITVHCVVNKLNIGEIPQILEYSIRENIEFSISNLIPINNKNSDNLVCTIEEIVHMLENNHILLKKISNDCSACKKVVGIKANGVYTPCLWISNYTNEYDTYNICDLEKKFTHEEQNSSSCRAMNINKALNKQKELVRSLTIRLN